MLSMDSNDSMWCSWEAGNGLPGMTANYLAAMDALNQVKLALLGPCHHSAPLQLSYRCMCLRGPESQHALAHTAADAAALITVPKQGPVGLPVTSNVLQALMGCGWGCRSAPPRCSWCKAWLSRA